MQGHSFTSLKPVLRYLYPIGRQSDCMAAITDRISILRLIPALLAGLFLFTGAAAGMVVTIDPSMIVLRPGVSTTVNLTLDSAPSGISGYAIEISMEHPGIAEITAVAFPSWTGLSDIKGVPGSDVQIEAVDLQGGVEKNASSVILATLTIVGENPGTTPLLLSDPVFDEDDGNRITPSMTNSSIMVSASGTAASGGSAAGGGGGGSITISAAAVTSPTLSQSGGESSVQTNITGETQTTAMETPSSIVTAAIKPTTGDQTAPVTLKGQGIPFLSLPTLLAILGIMAFLAAKKR
jgi:hypothetical protein